MRVLVDFAEDSVTIDSRTPRFSWEVPLAGRGRKQSAYRICVTTEGPLLMSGEPDLWDSGKVASDQSTSVPYAGRKLSSNMTCFWTVHLWDEAGNRVETDGIHQFDTPLYDAIDWQADWIGMGAPDEPFPDVASYQHETVSEEVKAFEPDPRAPMLRKVFELARPVKRARAFVCGVGLHELYVNGQKVGNDVFATPRTDFRQRLLYNAYDLTDLLAEGGNAIGIVLGNGWFNGKKKYWGWQYQWYGSPRAIAQVEVEFTDGSTERILSEGSWRGDWSPITSNCIYDGEVYDARLEQTGWDRADFDDSQWAAVNVVPSPGGTLAPMAHAPEKITETFAPVSIREPQPGVYVVDLGRNITGWIRLRLEGYAPGTVVKFHHGEAAHDDGSLNSSNNDQADQEDTYITKGAGVEVYEPRFTFHGFQFVEISGFNEPPKPEDITGCFVRTAVAQTGSFECASELLNKIHRCTLQSQLCNVQMGVPTDDTQRAERLGWGADAWATANEALYNLWMPRVYEKWIGDYRAQQTECGSVGMIVPQAGFEEDTVWSAAFLIVPWLTYLHTGDTRILEENYPNFQRYIEFLETCGVDKIQTMTSNEVINSILWRCGPGNRFPSEEDRGYLQLSQWGDHLSTVEDFDFRANHPLSVGTAFYYLQVTLMAKIARVMKRSGDASECDRLAERIKAAFHERFYDQKVGCYDTGLQSAQAWALVFGLVDDTEFERVQNRFVNEVANRQKHLTTGYVGTKFAIEALAQAGRNDVVWKLATATDYPSWGYMLRNNRTTTCEAWDGGGSLNHAPLGAAIDEWFYWGLAGIQPDESAPGYASITFKPYIPADLAWARASIRTMRGPVRSAWRREGDGVVLEITVPANSSATVVVPAASADEIMESGTPYAQADGVICLSSSELETQLKVGSGSYTFTFPLRKP